MQLPTECTTPTPVSRGRRPTGPWTLALAAVVSASLLACATLPAARVMLPPPLAVLTVNVDHPRMSPARFDHAAHAARAADAGEDACAGCHHPLRDDPRAVPQACTACHLPAYLAPEIDESKPHDHSAPPDL